jgi:transcriptional regulator with XRE-family HTH domain
MANKHQNNDPKSSASARGKRLKTVRMMAGMTRKNMEQRYQISASTIQSWEAAKAGGLTERGAHRVIPILRQEGIYCTTDWLLYGIGNPPQPTHLDNRLPPPETTDNPLIPEDKAIIQELLTFRELNAGVIDVMVNDDGMSPYYCSGDYVAGRRRKGEEINKLINQDCIVETINNEVLLRRIKNGSRLGAFTLICMNPDTSVSQPTLYDLELISAAPVIWHRRRDPK